MYKILVDGETMYFELQFHTPVRNPHEWTRALLINVLEITLESL